MCVCVTEIERVYLCVSVHTKVVIMQHLMSFYHCLSPQGTTVVAEIQGRVSHPAVYVYISSNAA